MGKLRILSCGLCILASVAAVSAGTPDDDAVIAELESRLAEQRALLTTLNEEVAAAGSFNQDAARVEAMKQQIREVLSEQEFRESLMPSMMQAGYDDGFFIKSSDDKFKMTFNGFVQFRWTHYSTGDNNRYLTPRQKRNDRTGFDITRFRLIFSGHAYTEDLTYYVHMMADAANNYNFGALWAWVNYRFRDEFNVQAGVFPIAATRAYWLDERGYQFVSRSISDVVFGTNIGDGVGVQFWGQLFDKKLDYYLSVTNSFAGAGNRTITNDPQQLDGNPGLAFRAVWHAMGEDPGAGLYEGDLWNLESPALDIGFHYAFNEDDGDANTTAIPFPIERRPLGVGGFGVTNTNGCQIHQFGVDASFKFRGFSAAGEYVMRSVDPRQANSRPFAPWWLLTRQGDTTVQHGAYVQMGYFLPIPGMENQLEAAVRVGGVSTLANSQEGTWEYAAGVNYYMQEHNVKLQADIVKITEAPMADAYVGTANVNDDALMFRVQLQVGF